MGGGGFIADMIARINYNKDMLSKRSYLNKNKEYTIQRLRKNQKQLVYRKWKNKPKLKK
jgi:hypothetical protein